MLGFICDPCAMAADVLEGMARTVARINRSKAMHKKCIGKDRCDCQHRVE